MAVQSQEELDKLFDQLDSEDKKKRAVPHIPHLITKLHGYQEQVLSHAHTRRSCVRPIRTDVYAVVTLRCHAQPPPGGVRGWRARPPAAAKTAPYCHLLALLRRRGSMSLRTNRNELAV